MSSGPSPGSSHFRWTSEKTEGKDRERQVPLPSITQFRVNSQTGRLSTFNLYPPVEDSFTFTMRLGTEYLCRVRIWSVCSNNDPIVVR